MTWFEPLYTKPKAPVPVPGYAVAEPRIWPPAAVAFIKNAMLNPVAKRVLRLLVPVPLRKRPRSIDLFRMPGVDASELPAPTSAAAYGKLLVPHPFWITALP